MACLTGPSRAPRRATCLQHSTPCALQPDGHDTVRRAPAVATNAGCR